ncbi:MAG: CRTAC1 family protein, partial [Planctomycetota bacterium]
EWFVDEAAARGIDLLNQTGEPRKKQFIMAAVGPGAAVFDADGDGRLDAHVPNGSWLVGGRRDRFYDGPDRPRDALYIQRPDGTFRDEAKERGVDDDAWSFGACAADLDNDGDQDLVVTNFGRNRLFVNDGKGFFRDVAGEAGVAGGADEWSTGIAFGDYDKDGLLDLYVSNYADMFTWMRKAREIIRDGQGNIVDAAICDWQRLKVYCGPVGLPAQQDHLYRNLGGMRFRDVTKESGVWMSEENGGPQYGFQPLFTDLNGDGWLDLYVANDSVPSFFFESRGDGTFVERANRYGIALSAMGTSLAGMGADSADVNGDGLLDLHKTNFALQENNVYVAERGAGGAIAYRDHAQRSGVREAVWNALAWSVCAFDYDHDADLDLFYANGHVYPEVDGVPELKMTFEQLNQLLRNDSEEREPGKIRLRFREVTAEAGSGFRAQKSSRGGSLGDFDNDGDLDLLVVNLNDRPNLLVNRLGSRSGHWLQLRLVGDPARKVNRDAIGSKVWVRAGGRSQFFETKRGQGFLGCHDPRLHVGLGGHAGPVAVEITWPNGETSTHDVPAPDREVLISMK